MVASKTNICNMAMSHLGNYDSINDIDLPITKHEKTCALWYDITRQYMLKLCMPNFALERKLVAELVVTIPFGYANAFEYPADCLKVLGLGNVDERDRYSYTVENNRIYTDDDWDGGLQLRYIKDVIAVGDMSPEFRMLLSVALAVNIALPVTQDATKKVAMQKMLEATLSSASSVNAQENRPIRISNSRFRNARFSYQADRMEKK